MSEGNNLTVEFTTNTNKNDESIKISEPVKPAEFVETAEISESIEPAEIGETTEISDPVEPAEIGETTEISDENKKETKKIIASDSLEALLFGEDVETKPYNELPCVSPEGNVFRWKIKIEKTALEKMFIMAQEVKNAIGSTKEVYSYSVGNRDGVITDILIPPQTVSYTSVNISMEDMSYVSQKVKELGEDEVILGWNHSHSDFGVFFSGTDDNNQEKIFHETTNFMVVPDIIGEADVRIKYAYGMTVNTKRDLFGVITAQLPCGHTIKREYVEFDIIGEFPEDWDETAVRESIRTELKSLIKTPPPVVPYYQRFGRSATPNTFNFMNYRERFNLDDVDFNDIPEVSFNKNEPEPEFEPEEQPDDEESIDISLSDIDAFLKMRSQTKRGRKRIRDVKRVLLQFYEFVKPKSEKNVGNEENNLDRFYI